MKILNKCDRILAKTEAAIAMFVLAVIVVVGTAQIFCRYVLNSSLIWSEEFMRYGFVWVSMLSCSIAMREHKHISVDFLTSTIGPKANLVLYIITRLLSVVYIVIMVPAGIQLCIKTSNAWASILPVTWSLVYAAYPIGLVLMLLSMISVCPGDIRKLAEEAKGGTK